MKSLITVHPFWYFYYHSPPPKKPFTEYLLGLEEVSEKEFDKKVLIGSDPEEILNGKFDLKRADCVVKSLVKYLVQYDMRLDASETNITRLKPVIAKSEQIYLTGSNLWDLGHYEGCIVTALGLISDFVPKEDRMDNLIVIGSGDFYDRTVYLLRKAILVLPPNREINTTRLTAQFTSIGRALQYNLQVLYNI